MELDPFLEFITPSVSKKAPSQFNTYIANNPTLIQQYADVLMYTLPAPRYKWYEPSNFEKI